MPEINSSVGKIKDLQEKQKLRKEKYKKQLKDFYELINSIAKTDIGREWLKFCYDVSEFGNVSLDVSPNLLQRKEALRYIYVKCMRQFFSGNTLRMIEKNYYGEEEFNEE